MLEGSTLYSVTDLGPAVNVRALNDKGQVLGTAENGSFFYDGSRRYTLPAPPSGVFSGAGLNNNGEIAGTVTNPGADYSLAIYSNGTYRLLGGSPNATATAINDAGQIAGDQVRSYRASLYSAGTFTSIGVLPGDSDSAARAIAPNGDVLAVSFRSSSYHPVIFSNGTLTPVPGSAGLNSEASGINSKGQVVGSVNMSSGDVVEEAVLFSGGEAHLLGALPGSGISESSADSINDSGVIVGMNLNSIYPKAIVDYSDTGLVDLNSLLVNGEGWTLRDADAINNEGQITGTGWYEGRNDAYLLTPVTTPEPATWALAAFGITTLGCFLRYARRRA